MTYNYNHIIVKDDTKQLIETAKEEFLKHHKEFENIPITNNFIINWVLRYYIK